MNKPAHITQMVSIMANMATMATGSNMTEDTSTMFSHSFQTTGTTTAPGQAPAAAQNIATVNVLMMWIYVVLGILGMTSNCCVALVILTSKQLRSHLPNVFLLNQCLADFWCAAFIVGSVFKNSKVKLYGLAGELTCRLWLSNLFLWIGFNASLYNLVALSIERYFEIVHPIKHKLLFNRRKAAVVLVCVWMIGVIWQTAAYVSNSAVIDGVCYTQAYWVDVAMRTYGMLNFAQKFVIPVVIFIWCNAAMARSLRDKVHPSAAQARRVSHISVTSAASSPYSRARRNITKTLLYIVTCHVLSWTMNQTLFFAYTFGYPLNFTSLVYQMSVVFIYFSTCVNPLVCLLKYERLRITLFRLLRRKHGRPGASTSVFTVNSVAT